MAIIGNIPYFQTNPYNVKINPQWIEIHWITSWNRNRKKTESCPYVRLIKVDNIPPTSRCLMQKVFLVAEMQVQTDSWQSHSLRRCERGCTTQPQCRCSFNSSARTSARIMMPSIWFETPESLLGTGFVDVGTVEVRC